MQTWLGSPRLPPAPRPWMSAACCAPRAAAARLASSALSASTSSAPSCAGRRGVGAAGWASRVPNEPARAMAAPSRRWGPAGRCTRRKPENPLPVAGRQADRPAAALSDGDSAGPESTGRKARPGKQRPERKDRKARPGKQTPESRDRKARTGKQRPESRDRKAKARLGQAKTRLGLAKTRAWGLPRGAV